MHDCTSKQLAALVDDLCHCTLAVRFTARTPARAGAFAAWMSRHAALLSALQLDLTAITVRQQQQRQQAQQQDPAVRILAQLPPDLTRLALSSFSSQAARAQQAAALADAMTQPMQLRQLELPRWRASDAAQRVLPALLALSALTSLAVSTPRDRHTAEMPADQLPAQLLRAPLSLITGAF